MPKPYDPVLDAETKEIVDSVYGVLLTHTGARHLRDEPNDPDDFKSWDKICLLPTDVSLWYEFEVRGLRAEYPVWSGPGKTTFTEQTVHVPYRKQDSKADLYISTNPYGTAFAATKLEIIKSSSVVPVPACNEPDMLAYNVGVSRWDWYLVENGALQLDERRSETERYLIPCR